MLNRAVGRYLLSNICNIDEIPLPFEYLSGKTYDIIGSRTVWVKETSSGWDKRQASLVLCVFADGVNRVPPLIIFYRSGTVYEREASQYHPGVIVEFNQEAYMNEQLFLKYIEQHLVPAPGPEGRPTLLDMDNCTSHKTPAVLDTLRTKNILPSLIPAGCTSLIQPLDISINKPLKDRIKELTDETIMLRNDDVIMPRNDDAIMLHNDEAIIGLGAGKGAGLETQKWTIGERRILTTWCVGDAWYQFSIAKSEVVCAAFRNVGLSLPVDGSADHELNIKGFEGIGVGSWECPPNPYTDIGVENDNSETVEFVAYGE